MLKACWDCIAGDQQRQTDDRYNIHMNGGSSAPPWPTSNDPRRKMFAVPTQLKSHDVIIIKGQMVDGIVDVALRLDSNESYQNIVCGLNVVYPDNGETRDQILITNAENGTSAPLHQLIASDYMSGTDFEFQFTLLPSAIDINAPYSVESIPSQHSPADIRYISVTGVVKELAFKFSSGEDD